MSGKSDADFLNRYLSGNEFRGRARTTGDRRCNDGDGDFDGDNAQNGNRDDSFADESLLVSPILADYVGGIGGGASSSSAKSGTKSRTRTGTVAEAIGFGCIPEGDEVNSGDSSSGRLIATAASPPRVDLGAQLQLDTSLCPSLGLGSVGSDDEGSIGGGEDEDEDAAVEYKDSVVSIMDGIPLGEKIIEEGASELHVPDEKDNPSQDQKSRETQESHPDGAETEQGGGESVGAVKESALDSAHGNTPDDSAPPLDPTPNDADSPENDDGANSVKTVKTELDDVENTEEGPVDAISAEASSLDTDPKHDSTPKDDDGNASPDLISPAGIGNAGDRGNSGNLSHEKDPANDDMGAVSVREGVNDSNALFRINECALSPIANGSPELSRTLKVEGNFDDGSSESKNVADAAVGISLARPLETSKIPTPNEGESIVRSPPLPCSSNATMFVGEQVHKVAETTVGSTMETAPDDDVAAANPSVGENETVLKNTNANGAVETNTGAFASCEKTSVCSEKDDNKGPNEADPQPIGGPNNTQRRHSFLSPGKLPSSPTATNNEVNASPGDVSTELAKSTYPLSPSEINASNSDSDISSEIANASFLNALDSMPNERPVVAESEQPNKLGAANAHSSPSNASQTQASSSPSTDLSSAKKQLGATSHALLQKLRGAAQKRKLQVTRSRDSLVAKEQQQIMSSQHSLSSQTSDDAEESCDLESPEPKAERTLNKRHYDGINPSRTFVARPLPATTGDLGHGGQVGVPKVTKRPTTVPRSPLLGGRSRKNANIESKAYQMIKEEESRRKALTKQQPLRPPRRESVVPKPPPEVDPYVPFKARPLPATTGDQGHGGQIGIPKVTKRPATVPSSPLLGKKRGTSNMHQRQQQARKSSVGMASRPLQAKPTRPISAVKQSALEAKPFNRLLAGSEASRAKEVALKEKREREKAEARRMSSFRARPLPASSVQSSPFESPGLRGLELLNSTGKRPRRKQASISGEENMGPIEGASSLESPPKKQCIASTAPKRLNSTVRAKERAEFDEKRALQEQKRHQEVVRHRKREIQAKIEELDDLRENL